MDAFSALVYPLCAFRGVGVGVLLGKFNTMTFILGFAQFLLVVGIVSLFIFLAPFADAGGAFTQVVWVLGFILTLGWALGTTN